MPRDLNEDDGCRFSSLRKIRLRANQYRVMVMDLLHTILQLWTIYLIPQEVSQSMASVVVHPSIWSPSCFVEIRADT